MAVPAASDAVGDKARAARRAALVLQSSSDAERQRAVFAVADRLWAARETIAAANAEDVEAAERGGVAAPLAARLKLDEAKLQTLLDGVRQVAKLPDPVGHTRRSMLLDDGLRLYQVTVPIGVVGVVFESRPDALVQIAALTVRSGNAALLKGGREAEQTNAVLAQEIRAALEQSGLPPDAVQRLEGRAEVGALLALDDLVDLIVPRGSSAFVRHILDNTRIPVLGHAEGVCHVYVDKDADLDQALEIWRDAKTDYPAACNAVETVLVHQDIADAFLPRLRQTAEARNIRLIEDGSGFGEEFGDLVCAVGVVEDLEAAIAHVNRYGSKHTDAIVTRDQAAARRFVAGIDASSVLVNASTRFADGYRYGLGAELGIATGKLHARGPVGVEGLVTTKWVVLGEGHLAGDYQGEDAKRFRHEPQGKDLDGAWA